VLALLSSLLAALGGFGASAQPASAAGAAAKPPGVAADMAVTSVGGLVNPSPDQTVTFLITVVNLGPSPATSVELATQLPTGVRFEPAQSDSRCSETAGVVLCRFSSWDVNAFGIVSVTVTPATAGTLQVTSAVTAAEPDPDLSNNSQTATVEVVEPVEADVSITLPSFAQLYAGQPMFYSVEVQNAGPATATGITATLDFPPGLSPLEQSACTATGTGLTCAYSFGDLPPQRGSGLPILLAPATAGSYTVHGRVSAAQPDPAGSNNSDTGVVDVWAVADVSVEVAESADPATPGRPLTYAVTITNAGPSPASAVRLVNAWSTTVRRGLELLSFTASQGQCSQTAAVTIECELGEVARGGTAAVTVTLWPRGPGTVTDEARVSAAESDPDSANNVDDETTSVGSVR
jgi:uncharacterized repeat protein (TIGR01451 family)